MPIAGLEGSLGGITLVLDAGGSGGAGVSSLNGLAGTLSLTSTGGTVTITPSGSTINLESKGGGGTPGGSNGQIQYNNSGTFAGAGNLDSGGNAQFTTVQTGTTNTTIIGGSNAVEVFMGNDSSAIYVEDDLGAQLMNLSGSTDDNTANLYFGAPTTIATRPNSDGTSRQITFQAGYVSASYSAITIDQSNDFGFGSGDVLYSLPDVNHTLHVVAAAPWQWTSSDPMNFDTSFGGPTGSINLNCNAGLGAAVNAGLNTLDDGTGNAVFQTLNSNGQIFCGTTVASTNVNVSSLTANSLVFSDGSKNLVSSGTAVVPQANGGMGKITTVTAGTSNIKTIVVDFTTYHTYRLYFNDISVSAVDRLLFDASSNGGSTFGTAAYQGSRQIAGTFSNQNNNMNGFTLGSDLSSGSMDIWQTTTSSNLRYTYSFFSAAPNFNQTGGGTVALIGACNLIRFITALGSVFDNGTIDYAPLIRR